MNCCRIESPIGPLLVYANGEDTALVKIAFGDVPSSGDTPTDTPLLCRAAAQLQQYFDGSRKEFDLPLAPEGTPFQQACWQALCTIPYGRTRSYGEQAKLVGSPKAGRAVGMANNRNPLPIVIPCHRVVGSSGNLVGYAGGLDAKEKLLALEAANSSWTHFGKKEQDHLSKADPALAKVIRSIPSPDYEMIPDLFTALVRNIVGQQISGKALKTVWQRAAESWGEITPENLNALSIEQLCAAGISGRKAEYIKAAAEAVLNKKLDLTALPQMDDDTAIQALCSLKGIGRWTAEMLLMFSLGRRNVLSFGDFGIRQGLCRIHALAEEELTKEKFEEFRRLYSPYGTVASLYLWAAGNSPVWPPPWTGWQE
ncbi:MAG: methylated-DNA--[Oscillospiraceae bacterium]|nr:methylated-DNA--[protein]-cysteine S-methyltransferase [Oscillospiraceae bacterium]